MTAADRGGADDCGGGATDLSEVERQVVREVNLARTRPRVYARYVVQTGIDTPAYSEAVDYLESVEPLPPLQVSECLNRSARDHVRDTGPAGRLGHVGTDGSNVGMRIARYVRRRPARAWGENISYGTTDGRAIVIGQIVDIDVAGRGHRENIYNPHYTHVGVAYGPHARYGVMCVIDFGRIR